MIVCLVVAVIYNFFLRIFAKSIIWVSIIGTGVLLLLLALFLQKYHNDNYPDTNPNKDTTGHLLQISVYVLYGLTGLYFLIVLCLFRNIAVSIAVLKTSSIVLLNNLRVIIIPFIASAFILTYIVAWVVGIVYLLSCGNIT
mmetsp:Transcript_10816/g.16438  ORF Transcript_10816/g.16438 Transcript_10816/m.16438 type:complete len:141 (-) Transcript_10816:780-1202(-)